MAEKLRVNIRKALISVCHQGKEKEQHCHKLNDGQKKLTGLGWLVVFLFVLGFCFVFSMKKQKNALAKQFKKLEEK